MSVYVADIETNGLNPTIIWMVGVLDYQTDEYTSYVGEDEVPVGLMRLAEADCVIGHNLRDYDAKQIRRMTGGLIDIRSEIIVDTLDLSRHLFPNLQNHKLGTWGDIFGLPKLDFKKFDEWDPEMIPYCERDVRLNKVLYDFLLAQLEEQAA